MSRKSCSLYRGSKQAAIKQKRVSRHAEPNRRSEDARMLGCILRLRMLEPHFAGFPAGRGQEAAEPGDRGHRHLAIMAGFGERGRRVRPLKMRDGALDIQPEGADVGPDGKVANLASQRLAQGRAGHHRTPDDSVRAGMFPLAHMKPKVGVSRHPRGMLGEQHHVGVRYAQEWITDGIAVEAHGSKQVTWIAAGSNGIGNLTQRTSKNSGNAEHGVCSATPSRSFS